MNKFVYIVDGGTVRPYDDHRMWDMVPSHHEAMIEFYESVHCDHGTGTRMALAVIRRASKLDNLGLAQAMVEISMGRANAVCLWAQVADENFGPTGYFVIFEA